MQSVQVSGQSFSPQQRLIQVVVLRGGGGHYATYLALRAVIEQQQWPWDLKVVLIDAIEADTAAASPRRDFYQRLAGSSDRFYDLIQKNGLAWLHLLTIHLHKLLTRLKHAVDVRLLAQEWQRHPPDLVISVVPFHNRAIWDSIQRVQPGTPIVTILTDFADCPPAYWIEPTTQNYLLCGTDQAVVQARSRGVAADRVIKTSGLVIHPRFYQPGVGDRRQARQDLGLDPDRLTGLVLFGANGSQAMLEIAQRLEPLAEHLQLIFLCGRNQAVELTLRQTASRQNRVIVPFTEDIPHYMHLADFLIGKPGNVSISEAIAMRLPVIVERNWLTLPQERYAADWIQTQEVGLTIPNFRQIAPAVEAFLQPANFARYRANVGAIANQAVFEIPALLNQLLTSPHPALTNRPSVSMEPSR